MALFPASASDLPKDAFLAAYKADHDNFTDCFAVRIDQEVPLSEYVEAFYTTWLFKLERAILSLVLRQKSTDEEAADLATGKSERYSVWTVEARSDVQLLMCPIGSKTRSWFMVGPLDGATMLYFGSAVVGIEIGPRTSRASALMFRWLLPFHIVYSRALLSLARARLRR